MIFAILKTVYITLGIVAASFFGWTVSKRPSDKTDEPHFNPAKSYLIGFIADFFDALGIGSFAVTISLNRFLKQIPTKFIPGTLNVAVGLFPTLVEALVSMRIIAVDSVTLLCTTVSAVVGGWLGAKLFSNLSEKWVSFIVGFLLILVGFIQLDKLLFSSGDILQGTIGLSGFRLVLVMIGALIIGGLQSGGLGFFAPTLALCLLLGMNTKSIYPIMMSGALGGMFGASFEFIRSGAFPKKASVFIMFGGITGVLLALFVVKSLPVLVMSWIVTVILFYVGFEMFIKGGRQIYGQPKTTN